MASSYDNNLRLDEMATGDGSGTWGTTTNTNLTLIGEAFGYATVAIADASTDTLTIPNGTETDSEPRAMYLKLTGGGQACTVTLAPNTASKVWIIENVTSYTLTFTQGSGANVAILAGETKMIATDGAGSGAVVYDVLTDLNLAGTTKTAALTNAGAFSNQGTVTVGVDDTGYDVKLFGATSGKYWLWDESADGVLQYSTLTVGVDDTGYDVKFFGATSGAYMLWDESADDLKLVGAAGLTVAADIDVDGTANLDVVDIDGATQADGTITVGVDDTGYDVKFFGATSGAYMLWDESADDLKLVGAAGLTVAGDADIDGTTNLDAVDIDGALTQDGGAVFNEDSADVDFRVESNLNTHAFFMDGAQNSILGVGITPEVWETDATAIQVGGLGAFWGKTAQSASAGTFMTNNVYDKASAGQAYIVTDEASLYNQDDGVHTFQVAASGSADAVISWTTGFEVLNSGIARAKNGLLFATDTAAANALDDYEEGTFTPSYAVGGGGSVNSVTGTNVGTYTKVGRICTVGVTSNYVSTTGTVTYYNLALPFTAADTASGMTGGGFGQETGQSGAGVLIKVEDNNSNAIIWDYDGSTVPANAYFSLAFTYQTA